MEISFYYAKLFYQHPFVVWKLTKHNGRYKRLFTQKTKKKIVAILNKHEET